MVHHWPTYWAQHQPHKQLCCSCPHQNHEHSHRSEQMSFPVCNNDDKVLNIWLWFTIKHTESAFYVSRWCCQHTQGKITWYYNIVCTWWTEKDWIVAKLFFFHLLLTTLYRTRVATITEDSNTNTATAISETAVLASISGPSSTVCNKTHSKRIFLTTSYILYQI